MKNKLKIEIMCTILSVCLLSAIVMLLLNIFKKEPVKQAVEPNHSYFTGVVTTFNASAAKEMKELADQSNEDEVQASVRKIKRSIHEAAYKGEYSTLIDNNCTKNLRASLEPLGYVLNDKDVEEQGGIYYSNTRTVYNKCKISWGKETKKDEVIK